MQFLENCGLRKNFLHRAFRPLQLRGRKPYSQYSSAAGARERSRADSLFHDGYIKMEEVPGIPQLARGPGAVVYSPLGEAPGDPDVVIFAGPAAQIMLLQEAAHRAGRTAQFPMLGRPTCMAIPAAMAKGAITSSGCVGNRVYTDLPDGELYAMVPGRDLERVADELETIASANAKLHEYHRSRRTELSTL